MNYDCHPSSQSAENPGNGTGDVSLFISSWYSHGSLYSYHSILTTTSLNSSNRKNNRNDLFAMSSVTRGPAWY